VNTVDFSLINPLAGIIYIPSAHDLLTDLRQIQLGTPSRSPPLKAAKH
jgi:hypothetical protein